MEADTVEAGNVFKDRTRHCRHFSLRALHFLVLSRGSCSWMSAERKNNFSTVADKVSFLIADVGRNAEKEVQLIMLCFR